MSANKNWIRAKCSYEKCKRLSAIADMNKAPRGVPIWRGNL